MKIEKERKKKKRNLQHGHENIEEQILEERRDVRIERSLGLFVLVAQNDSRELRCWGEH